ncbi:hypothetical protein EPO17_03345 [Patescibacteria group bacterium]|nr:MAG: hypothetical protein EPO17_03345 [Patescibacteria group bacterium]
MNPILKTAFIHAIATALYVALLVSGIFYAPKTPDQSFTILMPIIMLLLFVFSAAVTSYLVFGRPLLWYLDGRKAEALQLLAYTLLVLFVIIVLAVLSLSIMVL